MKYTGIYSITNTSNGKIYIGSSVDIEHRWRTHKSLLKNNIHCNRHLQSAWNKYGSESFIFEIVNVCDKENLIELEDYFMAAFNAMNRRYGYNFINASRTEMSDETRKKLGKANLGKRYSKEINAKKGLKKEDQVWTEERREKISVARKGKKLSKEHRLKLSESHRGYNPTVEARAAMSESAKRGWEKRKRNRRKCNVG